MTEYSMLIYLTIYLMITCKLGFAGNFTTPYEDDDLCYTIECKNGGYCDPVTLTCHCPAGYSGERCEDEVFNCKEEPCMHGGTCSMTRNKCYCVDPFYGERCQYTGNSWTNPTDEQKQMRSTIVSIAFACVVLFAVCFVVVYVNIRRIKERRESAEAEEEIRNAVQVDGPPRLRLPENMKRNQQRNIDIERDDSGCFGSQSMNLNIPWPSKPKRKQNMKKRLHGIATSPASLQTNNQDATYVAINPERSPSGVTIQGSSLVSLPPPYDDAVAIEVEAESPTETNSSGLFMHCMTDVLENNERDDSSRSTRRYRIGSSNSGTHLSRQESGIEEELDEGTVNEADRQDTTSDYILFNTSNHQSRESLAKSDHFKNNERKNGNHNGSNSCQS